MSDCPCGSGKNYTDCCEPAHTGTALPGTAEALMRSRYSAYVKQLIPYLGETLHPEHNQDWDEAATRVWSEGAEWQEMKILSTENGQQGDDEGMVEFSASYKEDGAQKHHHEVSRFAKKEGKWYYVNGSTPKPQTHVNETPKIGRNDPCPCGSGKKYKKCCGR